MFRVRRPQALPFLCLRPIIRDYCGGMELPETTKARTMLRTGNVSGALVELDRAEQIVTMANIEPMCKSVAHQKYYTLLFASPTPSINKQKITLLQQLSQESCSWSQVLFDDYILNNDLTKAENILHDRFKQDSSLRVQISTSRMLRYQSKPSVDCITEELSNFPHELQVEALCEKGDSLVASEEPHKAIPVYSDALHLYKKEKFGDYDKTCIDSICEAIEIRKGRALLVSNIGENKFQNESILEELNEIFTYGREKRTKHWAESAGVMGMIYQYKDSKFVYAEGLSGKALELLGDSSLPSFPVVTKQRIMVEIKKSLKQLAEKRAQSTLAARYQQEIDALPLSTLPSFSSHIPDTFKPLDYQEFLTFQEKLTWPAEPHK